jgi:hypothetical protein
MICECSIIYSPINKNLLRYCPDCDSSTGGTMGNVSHNHGCKYYNCKHQILYERQMRELWSKKEEEQEKKIIEFQNTIYKEIQKKLLDLDRRLFERVQNVIRLKTNKYIYVNCLMKK